MNQPAHPAAIDVAGEPYLRDAKGSLVPLGAVKAADLLMDEMVRKILGDARDLSATIKEFKGEVFGGVGALQALIAQNYGATIGGKKGNITLMSFDGCQKVQVQVADLLEFGPELQAAKLLIDECLTEWAVGGTMELRALVNRVFQVDKEGQINRAELFMLLRVEIGDARWARAMNAIKDSIRVIGSGLAAASTSPRPVPAVATVPPSPKGNLMSLLSTVRKILGIVATATAASWNKLIADTFAQAEAALTPIIGDEAKKLAADAEVTGESGWTKLASVVGDLATICATKGIKADLMVLTVIATKAVAQIKPDAPAILDATLEAAVTVAAGPTVGAIAAPVIEAGVAAATGTYEPAAT